jgi:hypothetical protein
MKPLIMSAKPIISIQYGKVLPRRLRDPDAARAALDAKGSPKLMGHRRAEHVTRHRAVVLIIVIASAGPSAPTGHRFALRSPLLAVRSYLRL